MPPSSFAAGQADLSADFQPTDFQKLADRIDTGLDCPETSRALVVFNLTEGILSGVAVFSASMSWSSGTLLPPVLVTDTEGNAVPAVIAEMTEGPDPKGRLDRCCLSFSLAFAAADVPAQGWRTYLAFYAETPSPLLSFASETPGLSVTETTRHDGSLPPVGRLADAAEGL